MNDSSQIALGLLYALLKDVRAAYPGLQDKLSRDYDRLLSCVESRGFTVFAVDLPAFGKHFDMCLAKGQFIPSGKPLTRLVSRKHKYPRLFSGLMQLVFDDSGFIRSEPDSDAIFFIRQLLYCFKKFGAETQRNASHRREEHPRRFEVINEFYQTEGQLPVPSTFWDSDDFPSARALRSVSFDDKQLPLFEAGRTYSADYRDGQESYSVCRGESHGTDNRTGEETSLLGMCQQVADRISVSLGEFLPFEHRMRHGPGAVSDVYRTSKYEFPTWTARLDRVFPEMEFAYANLNFWAGVGFGTDRHIDSGEGDCYRTGRDTGDGAATIPGRDKKRWFRRDDSSREGSIPFSRLIVVPKTYAKPRLIAAEPIAHQYTQQGILRFLERGIKRSLVAQSIRIEDQSFSRRAALQASKTGDMVTIDLESASDRLSCWIVERALRANYSLLQALHASRTRHLVNDIDKKSPSRINLRKFSTMGSAVIFPIQSIVYTIFAITAILHANDWAVTSKNIRRASRLCQVYGDDIIIPRKAGRRLLDILEATWMKVNLTKTFFDGYFRESCGMDAYRGVDVTPALAKTFFTQAKPATISSVVDTSNNFFKKGLWHSARYLERTIPQKWRKLLPVVQYGSGGLVLQSFVGSDVSHLKKKWDEDLHQVVYRVARYSTSHQVREPDGEQRFYQWLNEAPGPDYEFNPGRIVGAKERVFGAWTSQV